MRFNKGSGGDGEGMEKPPVGYAIGVLAAIFDLGVRETPGSTFGPKHQVCLWWELSHRDSEGKPFGLRDVVTMSTMEGAHLASRVEAILGRDMKPEEREAFDPSTVLGKRAKLLLAVSPKKPNGVPFVKMAMPVEATDPVVAVEGDYTSALPRFVSKLVGDAKVEAAMLADLRRGGGDLAVCAPKGNGVVPGRAPAGSAKSVGQGAPPPPPAAPTGLPEGWKAHTAPNGRTYYSRPDGSTTWEAPPTAPAAPPPPPAAPAAPPAPPAAPAAPTAAPKAAEAPAVPRAPGEDDLPF